MDGWRGPDCFQGRTRKFSRSLLDLNGHMAEQINEKLKKVISLIWGGRILNFDLHLTHKPQWGTFSIISWNDCRESPWQNDPTNDSYVTFMHLLRSRDRRRVQVSINRNMWPGNSKKNDNLLFKANLWLQVYTQMLRRRALLFGRGGNLKNRVVFYSAKAAFPHSSSATFLLGHVWFQVWNQFGRDESFQFH